jgi:hypothetical protein
LARAPREWPTTSARVGVGWRPLAGGPSGTGPAVPTRRMAPIIHACGAPQSFGGATGGAYSSIHASASGIHWLHGYPQWPASSIAKGSSRAVALTGVQWRPHRGARHRHAHRPL